MFSSIKELKVIVLIRYLTTLRSVQYDSVRVVL